VTSDRRYDKDTSLYCKLKVVTSVYVTNPVFLVPDGDQCSKYGKDSSLYYLAVQQLHLDPLYQQLHAPATSRLLDRDGDLVTDEG